MELFILHLFHSAVASAHVYPDYDSVISLRSLSTTLDHPTNLNSNGLNLSNVGIFDVRLS
jgi:hypothetical protein